MLASSLESQTFFGLLENPPALLAALRRSGLDPSLVLNTDGISLLMAARYERMQDTWESLLPMVQRPFPLHAACAGNLLEEASTALDAAPWAISLLSPDGWSALHLAATFSEAPMTRLLLARGASAQIHSRNSDHILPLHCACLSGKSESALLLIPVTGHVDTPTPKGQTPLMLAAQNGMTETVRALLSAGAHRQSHCAKGKTPRDYALDCQSPLDQETLLRIL